MYRVQAMSATLVFHISHVRVEVQSDEPAVLRGIRAAWLPAVAPVVEVRRTARFQTESRTWGHEIRVDGVVRSVAEDADAALPMLDAAIHAELRAWHADHGEVALLRAAMLQGPEGALLLLGESGAGKTLLARAAIERGYLYGSDELSVSSGTRVWGVARAPQLHVMRRRGPLPIWLAGADTKSYRLRAGGLEAGVLPLFTVPGAQVLRAPGFVSRSHIVLLSQGQSDRVESLDAMRGLTALHQASLLPPSALLGRVLRPGCVWRLQWRNPQTALARLEAALRDAQVSQHRFQ